MLITRKSLQSNKILHCEKPIHRVRFFAIHSKEKLNTDHNIIISINILTNRNSISSCIGINNHISKSYVFFLLNKTNQFNYTKIIHLKMNCPDYDSTHMFFCARRSFSSVKKLQLNMHLLVHFEFWFDPET